MDETRTGVALLLDELESGNEAALDALFTLLYDELSELARRQRRRWHGDYTLNTTALVHEAYLKLVGPGPADVRSRAHFFALASRAMRHILCNHARERRAQKRGGGAEVLPLDQALSPGPEPLAGEQRTDALVELDEALQRLERIDARRVRVVECRFFSGLTVDETAAALGVSARTVKRDWLVAQAWLHREMTASV